MYRSKRSLCDSTASKRLRIAEHATRIEDLPDELLLEVFDYLDGCHVYQAFSNLNQRLQDIFSSPIYRWKVKMGEHGQWQDFNDQKDVIFRYRRLIRSVSLASLSAIDSFFHSMTFNAVFQRLESIVAYGLESHALLPLLLTLTPLPRLYLLILTHCDQKSADYSNAYRVIFSLPVLKYNKLRFEGRPSRLLLTNMWNRPSTITHLNIDHTCFLYDLAHLLSYTPYLARLVCRRLIWSYQTIENTTINLPVLTHLSIEEGSLPFDHLAMFLKKISLSLQMLRISTSKDECYLDPHRWEQLIADYLPRLRRLHFEYREATSADIQLSPHHQGIDGFTSRFWLERRWYFNLEMTVNCNVVTPIVFSVHPYRKQWDDINREHWNAKVRAHEFTGSQLTISDPSSTNSNAALIDHYAAFFGIVPISRLDILCESVSTSTLLRLLFHLPNLHTLRVRSLSLAPPPSLCGTEEQTFRPITTHNQIHKVNIEQIKNLEEIQWLIDRCPAIEYFEIGCSDVTDCRALVRSILLQNHERLTRLRVLCLCSSKTETRSFKELRAMIELKKRYQKYAITQIGNRIYLQR